MTDTPYNKHGYFRAGLRTPELLRQYCGDQPRGVYQILNQLPPGFLVIENFLAPAQCQSIVTYAETQQARQSTVHGGAAARSKTLSHTRITDYIPITGIRDEVTGFMRRVFGDILQSQYGESLLWFEEPEILRYQPGGEYREHADAENWDKQEQRWVQHVDRHYSLLLYLNSEFTGGEIEFPNFGLRLYPKPGMLVLFPADHRYVHAARPTQSGQRYTLVCWCAVTGRELIESTPPRGATLAGDCPAGV